MIPDDNYNTVIFHTTFDQECIITGSKKANPTYHLLNLGMIVRNCVTELLVGDIKRQDLILCTTPRIPHVVSHYVINKYILIERTYCWSDHHRHTNGLTFTAGSLSTAFLLSGPWTKTLKIIKKRRIN